MPWTEGRVEQRKRMVGLFEAGTSVVALSEQFGVSRQTVYNVMERWRELGEAGLIDGSRAPHSNKRQTPETVRSALLNLKDRYPHFGPDKLVRLLQDEQIELSASTARDILRQNGRVQARRARSQRWSPVEAPQVGVPAPGQMMTADHKGAFRLGNGQYCHPLTIADPASRYIFAIEALSSTGVAVAMKVFERVFREWGLPEQILTDNGCPFCTARSIGGLTPLSLRWIELGIRHVRIQPGRPQQNGIHERMHRTLEAQAIHPPEYDCRRHQKRFDVFRYEFNEIRPHQGLGQERPASKVQPYRRPYPDRIPELEYPDSFTVRRVRGNGEIKWKGGSLLVGTVLSGKPVGLLQVDDDRWKLFVGGVHLADWKRGAKRLVPPGR